MRYRRSVLSPARWRLERSDLALPHGSASDVGCFREALAAWRHRWGCPALVELLDEDRGLRLDLEESAHIALLQAHLDRHETAQLTEARDTTGSLGWIGGYAHEIVFPLTAAGPPAPNPLSGTLPLLTNSGHGELPAHTEARWLQAHIPTHPERMSEIITDHLPALLATLGEDHAWWFVRYRSAHESDHLRLRMLTRDTRGSAALAQWAQHLREAHLAGPLTLGTYLPETGRYGVGTAMEAAEDVFAADSAVVAAQLRHLPEGLVDPIALTAAGMVATVRGLLGQNEAMAWLHARPVSGGGATVRSPATPSVWPSRPSTGCLLRLLPPGRRVIARWPPTAVLSGPRPTWTVVVESLLHMHHNRQRGIEREGEAVCRRLARQAAVTWQARQGGSAP